MEAMLLAQQNAECSATGASDCWWAEDFAPQDPVRPAFASRLASRADAAIVMNRHSRVVDSGIRSIDSSSSSQSSAEILPCSRPYNSVTALMKAANSRSAMLIRQAKFELWLFPAILLSWINRRWKRRPPRPDQATRFRTFDQRLASPVGSVDTSGARWGLGYLVHPRRFRAKHLAAARQ